jgi:hypothetical protein
MLDFKCYVITKQYFIIGGKRMNSVLNPSFCYFMFNLYLLKMFHVFGLSYLMEKCEVRSLTVYTNIHNGLM